MSAIAVEPAALPLPPSPGPPAPGLLAVVPPPGAWVDDLLARIGGTTAELAERVGVARSTPGRWRRGERPRPAVLARLAGLADLACEELAGRVYGACAPREYVEGAGLARARRAAGLDTSALARRLHVSVSTVSHWESGRRRPDPAVCGALAAVLGLSEAELDALVPVAARRLVGPVPGLRALREELGLSQVQLGTALGTSATTVSHWERGSRPFRWDRVGVLAGLAGLVDDQLVARLRTAPPGPDEFPPGPLEVWRRQAGLSVEEAARRLTVSRHRLRRWEHGEVPPLWAARGLSRLYAVGLRTVCEAAGVAAPSLVDPRSWTADRLPEVLRALQDWSGCPVGRLARGVGVSPSTVRRWHTGASLPSPRRLEAVERVYGLAAGELRRLREAG